MALKKQKIISVYEPWKTILIIKVVLIQFVSLANSESERKRRKSKERKITKFHLLGIKTKTAYFFRRNLLPKKNHSLNF